MLNQLPVGVIAEGNILNSHIAPGRFQGTGSILAFLRLLQQGEEPCCAGQSVLHLRDHGADVIEGLHILVGIGQQHRQAAYGQAAHGNQDRPQQGHACIDQAVDKPGAGIGQAAVEHRLGTVVTKLPVDFGKAPGGPFLIAIGTNHLLIADDLVDQCRLLAPGLALLAEHSIGVGGNELRHPEADRGQADDQQRNPKVLGEHEYQRHHNGDNAGKELGKAQQQAIGQDIRIGDDPADDVAGAVLIQIGQGQMLDMPDGLGADILDHTVGHAVVDDAHDPAGHSREHRQNDDTLQIEANHGKIHFSGRQDVVDGVAEQDGDIQLQNHGDTGHEHAQYQQHPELGNVIPELFQGLSVLRIGLSFHHTFPSFFSRSPGNWESKISW